MRQDKLSSPGKKVSGFTLFEMVVVICSIVILYMVAEQRLNELPAAAERANFLAVLEQIKAGVNFEMISKMTQGDNQGVRQMQGENPMSYLLDEPSNYLGELDQVTDAVRRRNAWYYESTTQELVYVVGGSSIDDVWVTIAAIPVNMGQIRFRIENIFTDQDGKKVSNTDMERAASGLDWEGIQLIPVHEYSWDRRQETPIELN